MKTIKTFISKNDEPIANKFEHLKDYYYEIEDLTIDRILSLVDDHRNNNLQLKYNLIIDDVLYLLFEEY